MERRVGVLVLWVLATPVQAERSEAELVRFGHDECGFCHGLHLTGGLGSALTPQALAGKSEATLVAITLQGLPGTAMPGWAGHLSPEEALRLIHYFRTGVAHE